GYGDAWAVVGAAGVPVGTGRRRGPGVGAGSWVGPSVWVTGRACADLPGAGDRARPYGQLGDASTAVACRGSVGRPPGGCLPSGPTGAAHGSSDRYGCGRNVVLGARPAPCALPKRPVRRSSHDLTVAGEGEFGPDHRAQSGTEGEVHHCSAAPPGGQVVDEQQAPPAFGFLPFLDRTLRDLRNGGDIGAYAVVHKGQVDGVGGGHRQGPDHSATRLAGAGV